MRAIVIQKFGGPENLAIKEIPDPEPKPGHVGGLAPAPDFNPLLHMASGFHFSFFGSVVFGKPGFPLSDVPLQTIADLVAAGRYQAKPV